VATKTQVIFIDDLTGEQLADGQTVEFGIDGERYTIDLTNEHADELREALARYVEAARKTGSERPARARSRGRSHVE